MCRPLAINNVAEMVRARPEEARVKTLVGVLKDTTSQVCGLRVLCLLALLCQGDIRTRMKLVFRMFDFDKSGYLSNTELRMAVMALMGKMVFFVGYSHDILGLCLSNLNQPVIPFVISSETRRYFYYYVANMTDLHVCCSDYSHSCSSRHPG